MVKGEQGPRKQPLMINQGGSLNAAACHIPLTGQGFMSAQYGEGEP